MQIQFHDSWKKAEAVLGAITVLGPAYSLGSGRGYRTSGIALGVLKRHWKKEQAGWPDDQLFAIVRSEITGRFFITYQKFSARAGVSK